MAILHHHHLKQERGFTIVELLIVVVIIAILAAVTVVSYNGISSRAKTSARAQDVAQWKKKSELRKIEKNIECPLNYVFVYGNASLGTDDFCVMKYEATNDGSGNAVSIAAGAPWVSITQTAAITAANAAGGHLITEAEWMTVAADVLSVKYNWSGGAVGLGYIYQGHVNNNPSVALAASTDDNDNLYGVTGGTGTTVGTNSQRTLLLSSGDTIWDFSGNVWEWTQQAIGTPALAISQIGVNGDSTFTWREYTLGTLSLGNLPANSRPNALAISTSLSAINTWNSSRGIGQIYAHYSATGARAFLRGGNWGDTSHTGILSLTMNDPVSYSFNTLGFRVAR